MLAAALAAVPEEGAAAPHRVPGGVTALFAVLLVAMILSIALEEKIHAKKSVIAGVYAVIALFLAEVFHLVPEHALVTIFSEKVEVPIYIPAIDWNVIALIFGASVFVDAVSKSGLFTWVAIRLTKASGGDPMRLLWFYGIMTVAFSAVLNNVTAMLIVGSLTGVSLGKLGRTDKLLGFLVIEGLLTNVGGLLTLISSVPNIIVGSAAGFSFLQFLKIAAPYVVVSTAFTIVLGAKLMGIRGLPAGPERDEARRQVAGFDENEAVTSRGFFWFGASMTFAFLGVIAATAQIPYLRELGMGFVALLFATIMLVRYKSTADKFYQAFDWDLLGFFAALFVVINMMEHAQVLSLIGQGLAKVIGLGPTAGPGAVLVASAAASSVTDNVPLAAMLAKILVAMKVDNTSPLWWSVIFGANLGGNLTPIGSASTLVAVTIIHKQGLKLGFGAFVKVAAPYAIGQLALAAVYVLVLLR